MDGVLVPLSRCASLPLIYAIDIGKGWDAHLGETPRNCIGGQTFVGAPLKYPRYGSSFCLDDLHFTIHLAPTRRVVCLVEYITVWSERRCDDASFTRPGVSPSHGSPPNV